MSSTCDESRCVSKGNSLAYNGSFTCYGDGIFHPKMCADGYLPVDVTDEAPIAVPDPIFGQVTLQYFTCCPPSHSALTTTTTESASASESITNITSSNMEEPVARHCSDPMSGVGQDEICRDMGSQQFARPLNIDFFKKFTPFGSMTVRKEDSFLCCDEDTSNNSAIDFLDEIECLPYANQVYEPAVFFSIVGIIDVVDCDIPDFTVPRPLFGDDADFAGPVYQCCKTGTPLPPFVHDRAFKVTVYTEMVIASIAVFVSLIAGVALLIPLFQQMKEEANKRRNSSSKGIPSSNLDASTSSKKAPSSRFSTLTSSFSSKVSMMRSFQGSVRASTRGSVRGKSVPKYSTYNIYLVYLVLADFFYFLMYIALFGTNINQKFYPQFFASLLVPSTYGIYSFENKIAYPYVAANLWINAIICYQLLVLLKSSKRAKRIQQPSAKLVNIQIWVVYLFVTICGIILDYLWNAMNAAGTEGNLERQQTLLLIANCLLGFMGLPPFVYAIYVSFVIWWGGYIPSIKGATPRAKAMRQLAFYFFRIIAVFLGVWFPVYTCLVLALQLQEYWLLAVGYWLTASQPILTFLVVLTKSDARLYVWDLVTFSHLIKYCKNRKREDDVDVGGGSGSQEGALKKDLEGGGTASGFTESVQTNSILSKSGVEDVSGENRNVSNRNSSGRGESIEEEEEEDLLEDDSEAIIASVLGFSSHFNMRDSRHGAGLGVDASQKSVSSVDLWAPKE